jgi:hypothetical protein
VKFVIIERHGCRPARKEVVLKVGLSSVVCASPNEVSRRIGDEIGDEAALLDLDSSMYYGLDRVGARIFDLLQAPTALHDVLATLLAEYEVDEPTARADPLELVDKRLVVIGGDAA